VGTCAQSDPHPPCLPPAAARQLRASRLQQQLEECMVAIVAAVNDKKDHIPPVTASATITFPFDITMSA